MSLFNCSTNQTEKQVLNAPDILGNKNYQAISFGGFREKTRDLCPSVEELKEDMLLISAMGIKMIRTYNTHLYPHAERTLQAINELKQEDPNFEMYVMLGAWIECEGAWTEHRNHEVGNTVGNEAEINKAVELAQKHPDIVRIIAVGNESMVHWAETYFVAPHVVLKYVNQLQELKSKGELDSNLWITSSDNFASWGGGGAEYHKPDLIALYKAVDYISMHTYPFHDSHYNPTYWLSDSADSNLTQVELAKIGMQKAADYAKSQYQSVKEYMKSIHIDKAIHIGETGWSTSSHANYGAHGSHAADEFKQKLYYDAMRTWTNELGLSCFFFEAFDEQWKDLNDPRASENHFGLIDLEGNAKYVLWDMVDQGAFNGLKRNGKNIGKTYGGNEDTVLEAVLAPPFVYNNHE